MTVSNVVHKPKMYEQGDLSACRLDSLISCVGRRPAQHAPPDVLVVGGVVGVATVDVIIDNGKRRVQVKRRFKKQWWWWWA